MEILGNVILPKSQCKFYVHNLDKNLKRVVERKLSTEGIRIKYDGIFKPEHYEMISYRLSIIYSRLFQFPEAFLSTWKISATPGFILYVKDGEHVKVQNSKKKRKLTNVEAEKLIINGIIIQYYGSSTFESFECYITKTRQESELLHEIKNLPVFNPDFQMMNFSNPFSSNVTIVKVGTIALTNLAPDYLQAFDTVIPGVGIFNSRGHINSKFLEFQPASMRKISVIAYQDCVVLNNVSQILDSDVLCLIPAYLLFDDSLVKLQKVFELEFKRLGLKVLGESGLTLVKMIKSSGSFFLTTILPIKTERVLFLNSSMLLYLLISSFSSGLVINADDLEKGVRLLPIKPKARVPSDSLLVVGLQIRKTFLLENDMGITVTAPKGSFKSGVIELLNDLAPQLITIDSDVYGRWVSLMHNDNIKTIPPIQELNAVDAHIRFDSFFESVALEIVTDESLNEGEKVDKFKRIYTKILSDSLFGIAKFQDYIYSGYGTTKVILFNHSTVESNLMSGKWQQTVIRPINDTKASILSRNREKVSVNLFLHDVYLYMTPTYNRPNISWLEFFVIVAPEILSYVRSNFRDYSSVSH